MSIKLQHVTSFDDKKDVTNLSSAKQGTQKFYLSCAIIFFEFAHVRLSLERMKNIPCFILKDTL